nr:hypothetical protein [Carnobacterium maltaromaticum]
MTKKLEEVFKELQESHVLVEREEHEKLIENAKEAEIEAVKFEAGGYYAFEDAIFKIKGLGESHHITSFYLQDTDWMRTSFLVYADSVIAEEAHKATDEEIKLFKRAAMYHKHGRELDELKVGDLLIYNHSEIFRLDKTSKAEFWVTDITINEEAEIYLTVEEQQEAYKKIVGG